MFPLVAGFAADGPAVDWMKHHVLNSSIYKPATALNMWAKSFPSKTCFVGHESRFNCSPPACFPGLAHRLQKRVRETQPAHEGKVFFNTC
jgi:hypothetical protein